MTGSSSTDKEQGSQSQKHWTLLKKLRGLGTLAKDALTFDLEGEKAVTEILNLFPDKVKLRAMKKGYSKAASRMRTALRRDAPKGTGTLRKAIRVRRHRNGSFSVGLKERYYYKTLEFMYPSGGAYRPWFVESVKRHAKPILGICEEAVKAALAQEAGKAYQYSKQNLRRSRIKGRR